MSELERVLEALEDPRGVPGGATADAARLLRALAKDFEIHAQQHGIGRDGWCDMGDRVLAQLSVRGCTCGLYAAREKWRLP